MFLSSNPGIQSIAILVRTALQSVIVLRFCFTFFLLVFLSNVLLPFCDRFLVTLLLLFWFIDFHMCLCYSSFYTLQVEACNTIATNTIEVIPGTRDGWISSTKQANYTHRYLISNSMRFPGWEKRY